MAKGVRINTKKGTVWQSIFNSNSGNYLNLIIKLISKNETKEKLSKFIKIDGGYAFKTAEYKKEGVPIVRISDFDGEQVVLKNSVYYKESDYLSKYELFAGDIVIALTGGTIGKLGIVPEGLGKLYLNQRVGRFRIIDETIFEKDFIFYLSKGVQEIIKTLAWGTAIPNVSPKQIEELKFNIPTKIIQKSVIKFLEDLYKNDLKIGIYFDKGVEKEIVNLHNKLICIETQKNILTAQQTLIKKIKQAYLSEAIRGELVEQDPSDEPASELLARIKSEKLKTQTKKAPPLKPITAEEILFEIPVSWTWSRLGEIITMVYGSGLTKSECISNASYPVYGSNGIVGFYDKYLTDKKSIIIGRKGSSGALNIATLPSWTTDVAYYIEESQELIFDYLVFLLKSLNLESMGKGLKPGLNRNDAYDLLIPLPPLPEQERIVARLDELMTFCDSLESENLRSQAQTNELLAVVLKESLEG